MAVSLDQVQNLATDQASLRAAAGLVKPGKWSDAGASDDGALIWGQCAGSGANPYRVMADLRDLGSKCTCPSRKFPCKHSLALLWLSAEGTIAFPAAETPEWVSDWLGRRRGTKPAVAAAVGDKNLRAARVVTPEPELDEATVAKRQAAAERRAADTQRAIGDALDALEQWVGDQLRLGLGSFIDDATARCRRIAARLVDGKAATLAGQVDELPARLLSLPAGERIRGATIELARLVVIARAWRTDPADPELRRAVAMAETRETLLDNPETLKVASAWEVIAEQVLTRRDGLVAQTSWLLNLGPLGPRFAALTDFFPASTGRRSTVFAPGEQFAATLAFYPARFPLRAVLVEREADASAFLPWPDDGSDPVARISAAGLAAPWANEHPVLLPPGRIGFDTAGTAWWRAEDGELTLPVSGKLTGLATGAPIERAAALWSAGRLELLASQTPWGRVAHG